MGRPRALATHALRLGVLWAFAVAQPLLQLIGDKPAFLAVRGLKPLEVVLLTLALCLTVPAVLVLAEVLVRRAHPPTQRALHALFCGLLVTAVALPPLGRTSISPWLALCLAAMIGLGTGLALDRARPVRLFLAYATPAIVLFPVLFWLRPGVAKLLFQSNAAIEAPRLQDAETPIVVIIFDELPITSLLDEIDRIDSRLFPHFAAFAEQATWYRHTAAASDFTVLAVPAILTGRMPEPGRLPIASDHQESLFTLLGSRFEMNVVETLTQVCPAHLCSADADGSWARARTMASDLSILYLHVLLPPAWTRGLPPVAENWMLFAGHDDWREDWRQRGSGDREAQVERFLEGIQPTQEPVLHLLHVLLPHPPFLYLPSGQRYSTEGHVVGLDRDTLPDDPWALTQIHQRHLLQVGLADRILGRVRARLEATDLWDRAIVAVTADHGASFVANHKRRSVGRANFGEVVPVPLLIKVPGQQTGRIDHRQASVVDLLPTLLDEAGITAPWPLDGQSLADLGIPGRQHVTVIPYRTRKTKARIYSHRDLVTDQARALALRDHRFGTGADRDLYRIGPHPDLHGCSTAGLVAPDPAPYSADLRLPWKALDLGPDPPFVPAHLSGSLVAPETAPGHPQPLAVAINGIIAGTTLSWSFEPDRWSVVVDPTVFRGGTNELTLYSIDTGSSKLRLHPIRIIQDAFSLVQKSSGLYPVETWPRGRVRWTNGDTELRLPLNRAQPPRFLSLTVVATPPRGVRLQVTVNGTRLFEGHLAGLDHTAPWHRKLDLGQVVMTDQLVVQLTSGSYVPNEHFPDQDDTRQLGVALAAIDLLSP